MTDEETEVPAMKKYLEHLEMLDKTHEYAAKGWRRTIKDVANWKDLQLYLQKKYGVAPKTGSKAEDPAVIPSGLGRLKNDLGERWRNLAYGGMGTRSFFRDKLENYKELPDVSNKFLEKYDAKKAGEKVEFDKVELEKPEAYNPKDSKEYGLKEKVKDKFGAAITKAKSWYGPAQDKLENYVELEDSPNIRDSPISSHDGKDSPSPPKKGRLVKLSDIRGRTYMSYEPINVTGEGSDRRYAVSNAAIESPISESDARKSYKDASDALLTPVGINDRSQYAPERAGRPTISKEDNSTVIEKMRKNLKKGIHIRPTDEKYTTANAAGANQYVKEIHGK